MVMLRPSPGAGDKTRKARRHINVRVPPSEPTRMMCTAFIGTHISNTLRSDIRKARATLANCLKPMSDLKDLIRKYGFSIASGELQFIEGKLVCHSFRAASNCSNHGCCRDS